MDTPQPHSPLLPPCDTDDATSNKHAYPITGEELAIPPGTYSDNTLGYSIPPQALDIEEPWIATSGWIPSPSDTVPAAAQSDGVVIPCSPQPSGITINELSASASESASACTIDLSSPVILAPSASPDYSLVPDVRGLLFNCVHYLILCIYRG